jgi:ferredoxin-NADP reductase
MRVVLAVAEVPNGEVSPFLVHDLRPGDQVEMHGPLGAYFVWAPPAVDPVPVLNGPGSAGAAAAPSVPSASVLAPVQLIAGGSGVVPLFAMASAHSMAADDTPFRLLYSVRTPADVFFADELAAFATAPAPATLDLDVVYTREAPADSPRAPGRLTAELVRQLTWPAEASPRVFVCGPTPFVETVARWLVAMGHPPGAIRTERFGGA